MNINLCMGCMREKTEKGACKYCGFDESVYEASLHQLPPGTVLNGKYLIGKVLGEGGFGITYLGWDLNLEMKLAVKEYFPNGFVGRDKARSVTLLSGQRTEFFRKGLDKFVDEAKRLAKFWGLPGIVSVKDYFQENRTAYIVMEFVEGKTLKQLLKEADTGRMEPDTVFAMMEPMMRSLQEVHAAGLIHRDISPDNIMVTPEGNVKLLDFGAARDYIAEGERSLSVVLKPGYAPEEQYRSHGKQGPWTDVYGLCATIYRAVTGEVPIESLDRTAGEELKKPYELGIQIGSRREDILMKGLALYQRDRVQTTEELMEGFYRNGGEIGEEEKEEIEKLEPERGEGSFYWKTCGVEDMPGVEKAAQKKKRGNRKWWIGAGVAVVVLCLLIGLGNKGNHIEEPLVTRNEDGETVISLSDRGITDITPWLPQLRNAKIVDLSNNYISDVSALASLTNVTNLNLSNNAISDVSALASLTGLTDLNLCWNEIDTISALTSLSNLATLDLGRNEIVDISELIKVLSNIPSIDALGLGGNKISDISFLSNIPNLTKLDLSYNEINDISVLANLPHLSSLMLIGNSINNIEILANLTNLTELSIEIDSFPSNWSVLSNLENLTKLSLYAHTINDISALSKLENLTYLSLQGGGTSKIIDISALSKLENLTTLKCELVGKIDDISVLSNLENLTELYLSLNKINDISALSNLKNLTILDLGANEINDISVLSNLKNLKKLNLDLNEIDDISALSSLENLNELYLRKSGINDINALSNLENLTELYLSENGINDISVLSNLENLIELELSENEINDVSALSNLENLTILDLSENGINDISVLSNLENLKELKLSENKINDISALSNLENLTYLTLADNEITDKSPLDTLSATCSIYW